MGDFSQQGPRRYARPGEFEIPEENEKPTSILESNSFNRRLSRELDRDVKGSAPTGSALRTAAQVNSSHENPPLAPRPAGPIAESNPTLGSLAPAPRPSRLIGESNPIPRSLAPAPRPVRPLGELNPVPRSVPPAPRFGRPVGQLNSARKGFPSAAVNETHVWRSVSARFELLPEPQSRWNRIGWSAAAQLGFLGLLLLSPFIFPEQMQTALKFDVVELAQPVTHINIDIAPTPPPPPPPKVKPKVPPPEAKPKVPKPKLIEVEAPVLNPRQPHVFLIVKPELRKVHIVEAKPVDLKPVIQPVEIVLTSSQPKRPKEEVKTANLNPGPPAPATVTAPANKVQTGGFGDPNGIPGPGNPNKGGNINQAGSPNLPSGPGSGNGSGGAQGLRGTVASDGSNVSAPAAGGVSTGVSILYEPNPAYTNEARVLKMEGDVVLEVVFLASGQLQITRVVSGLGHGLDEAAIQAAKLIRFRPAKRNGQSIDFAAHVRIEFRLSK